MRLVVATMMSTGQLLDPDMAPAWTSRLRIKLETEMIPEHD